MTSDEQFAGFLADVQGWQDEAERTPTPPPSCEGGCVTANDIGVSEYGGMIAYPHPDCPVHGDPEVIHP